MDELVHSKNYLSSQRAYHQYDARTHCTLLTGTSGQILEQYEYDAFGQPYFYTPQGTPMTVNNNPGSTFGNRFLFTGREWLPELRIYDFRKRVYQPELGRFLQPDPIQFAAGDYNLYRYCHNDPVNRSDPFGLKDREIDPKDLKKAEALLRTIEKAARKDHVDRTQGVKKDGTTTPEAKAEVKTRHVMGRFKSDQKRETIPGNKDTVSILAHHHANARGGSTAKPSEDVDVPLGKTMFILFGSDTLKQQGSAILIVPQVNPNDRPSQYTRPMTYAPDDP